MRTTARMYELTAPSEALPGATGYPSGYRVPPGCFHGARVRGHVRYEPLRIRRPHGMHPDLLYACMYAARFASSPSSSAAPQTTTR